MKFALLCWLSACVIAAGGCKSSVPVVQETPVTVTQNPGTSIDEIITLTRQGASPTVIINQINNTRSTYALTVDQIGFLKQQGVSDDVIVCMQSRAPGRSVAVAPPPSPPSYVTPVGYPAYAAYPYPYPVYACPYGYYRGGFCCR